MWVQKHHSKVTDLIRRKYLQSDRRGGRVVGSAITLKLCSWVAEYFGDDDLWIKRPLEAPANQMGEPLICRSTNQVLHVQNECWREGAKGYHAGLRWAEDYGKILQLPADGFIMCWCILYMLTHITEHTLLDLKSRIQKCPTSVSSVCFCFRSSSMFSEVWELKCLNHGF